MENKQIMLENLAAVLQELFVMYSWHHYSHNVGDAITHEASAYMVGLTWEQFKYLVQCIADAFALADYKSVVPNALISREDGWGDNGYQALLDHLAARNLLDETEYCLAN